VEPDDVGVALADHCGALRHDRRLRSIEPVEDLGLVVERRLGRVLVLALVTGPLSAGEDAPAEADRVTPVVVDREPDAGTEVVVAPTPAVLPGEAGALGQVLVEPERPGERIPGVGRPPDLEV